MTLDCFQLGPELRRQMPDRCLPFFRDCFDIANATHPHSMADETPERSAYLPPHARSQASNNWRVKDDSPRAETPQKNNRNIDNSNVDAGKRLYVGNLLYTASREDVEELFTSNGFTLSGISMSVDPFVSTSHFYCFGSMLILVGQTHRNPSYCFVDLESPDEANRALEAMQGKELLGREVKLNVGVRRQAPSGERRVRNFADGSYKEDRRKRMPFYPDQANEYRPRQQWLSSVQPLGED